MKKTLFTLTLVLLLLTNTNAQDYSTFLNRGVELYDSCKFYLAYQQFSFAQQTAEFKKNSANIDSAKKWINKTVANLEIKMRLSDSLTIIANQEKANAKQALVKAEEMQRRIETAIFDKAVKEHNKNWKGYAIHNKLDYLDDAGNAILEKIDSLDLSSNALLHLPIEITKCPNLKHINLFNNNEIDWNDCFKKINSNPSINSVYISTNNLDSIPSQYWKKITGIQLTQNDLNQIPENILQQTQLIYLDLSNCGIDSISPKIKKLKNLKFLNLCYNELTEIPSEIGNLTSLTILGLVQNQLTELPNEIGNLSSLISLGLGSNQLSQIPKELEKLTNLKDLDLSYNKFTQYPNQLEKLTNLEYLNLNNNELSYLPKEIGNLTKLINLNLSKNQLIEFPNELGKLTNLTYLNISGNKTIKIANKIKNNPKINLIGYTNVESAAYNDKIIESQSSIITKIDDLTNSFTDYIPQVMDLCLKNAIDETNKQLELIEKINSFYGDDVLRQAAIELFKCYKSVIENEFNQMVTIYKIPDEHFKDEHFQEFDDLQNTALKKMSEAEEKFTKIQDEFATKYNLLLK